MYNTPPPAQHELPSSRALLRSTIIATLTAAFILIAIVLPAEYGIDPTGIGQVLGLTRMGEIKMALAREAALEDSLAAAGVLTSPIASMAALPSDSTSNAHVTEITLAPDEGKEVKLLMREGASVKYNWATNRGEVIFDMHGDRGTSARGDYHGYDQGQGVWSDEGVLTAAFDGQHGWFWRNRTQDDVTITLRTDGAYSELKKME